MPQSLALLLALLSPAEVPTRVDDIPVLERPGEHFYGAIAGGKGVKARWQMSTASVQFGETFILTLVIENAVNPNELIAPPLLDFTKFQDLFSSIDVLPTDPAESGEVVFRYRVTPRNEGKFDIPELVYKFYQPNAPSGFRTQTTHARKQSFSVTKPPIPRSPPIIGPEEFFAVRTDGPFNRSGAPDWWLWVALFASGALVTVFWVLVWRRLYPDAARLAAIRHYRAVRIALDRLRRPHVSPDAIAITLRNFLIARYGLAYTAQTPAEVAAGLAEVGVSKTQVTEAEGVLRACDASRFSVASDNQVSGVVVAAMIERWEGVR